MDRTAWIKADYQVMIVYSIAAIILVYYIYFEWGPYLLYRLNLQFEKHSVLQALSEEIARDEGAILQEDNLYSIPKVEALAAESDPSVFARTVNPKYKLSVPTPLNKASTLKSGDHSRILTALKGSIKIKPPKFKIKSEPNNDDSDVDSSSHLNNLTQSTILNENLSGGLNIDSIEARLHQSIVNDRAWNNTFAFGSHDFIGGISSTNYNHADNVVSIDTTIRASQDMMNVHASNATIRAEQDREYQASIEEDQRTQEAKLALQVVLISQSCMH